MRFAIVLMSLIVFCKGVWAQSPATPGYQTAAAEAILIDAETGATLFEKQADKLFAPASMSKLMTLELLFKKLKAGEITLDTEFPASEHAWRTGGAPSRTTAMFIPLNTTATVRDLIQGITVQNGNDASIVVAEGLSGTEGAFAQAMTERARALGFEKSTFANASGLPDPGNQMTARDLGLLALHLIREYPTYYPYFGQKDFKYHTHTFINLNPLLSAYPGADGLKPGYVEDAGYGIVASAVKDGRRLIVVVNGLDDEKQRKEETVKLFNWGFSNFKSYKVISAGEIVSEARVWGGEKRHVAVRAQSDVRILLPISAKDLRLKGQLIYQGPLRPPVKEGDKIGELKITSETGTSNTVILYAAENIEPTTMVHKGLDSLVLHMDALVSRAIGKLLSAARRKPRA